MKKRIFFTFCLLCSFLPLKSQEKKSIWIQEPYRTGNIISFKRYVDGTETLGSSGERVRNFIYNHYVEEFGVYSRVDLSIMQLILAERSKHWSLRFLLGFFWNEQPIKLGSNINSYIGTGVDFDLTFTEIFTNGTKLTDFGTGTIGLNLRYDIEFGESFIIQNSVTRGWWRPNEAVKWDFVSLFGVNIYNGIYLTVAPNFLSSSLIISDENTPTVTKETSRQFYINYGIGITL